MPTYYSIITNRGAELEAEALANGGTVNLTQFSVGDGNGQAQIPDPALIELVNEVYRGDISGKTVSPEQPNQTVVQLVIPENVGGFTIREIGLLTDAGELYAIGNCAAIEKPTSGVSLGMNFRLAVSPTSDITIIVTTGDGLFLRQDANLADVKDKAAARTNLQLGSASQHDDSEYVNTVNGASPDDNGNAVVTTGFLSGGTLSIGSGTDMLTYFYDNPHAVYRSAGGDTLSAPPNWNFGPLHFQIHNDPDTDGKAVYGTLTAYNADGAVWKNFLNVGEWGGWRLMYSDDHKPTAQAIGAVMKAFSVDAGFAGGGDANLPYMGHEPSGLPVYLARADNVVADMRLGARQELARNTGHDSGVYFEAPAGCVMTGLGTSSFDNSDSIDVFYYRAIQKFTSTGWHNIGAESLLSGESWQELLKIFDPDTYKVLYDANGFITGVAQDASMLFPYDVYVAEVAELPVDFTSLAYTFDGYAFTPRAVKAPKADS